MTRRSEKSIVRKQKSINRLARRIITAMRLGDTTHESLEAEKGRIAKKRW